MKATIIKRAVLAYKRKFCPDKITIDEWIEAYPPKKHDIEEKEEINTGMTPIHTCIETTITSWYEGLAAPIVLSGEGKKGEDGNVIPFPNTPQEEPEDPKGVA